MKYLFVLFIALSIPAQADTVFASRTIRPSTVLAPTDLITRRVSVPGAIEDPLQAIGMETRVALYAGRPVRLGDIGPPALVDRNQIITLRYDRGGVVIESVGRALARGGLGDRVRVMNLSSRSIVWGGVQQDGSVRIEN